MTPRIRKRLSHGTMLLFIGAVFCGCSTVKPSTDYVRSLQQAALRGEVQSGPLDVAHECPICNPDEAIFAQQIVDAEQRFGAGCKEIPGAEASYRMIKAMMQSDDLVPGYKNFVDTRMCQVAEKYQACAAPEHRAVSVGDSTGPAGALIAAIDQCREHNPAEADEILNRAIAMESESINRAVLAGNYADAKPELRIYAALPRSNQQRAQEWRTSIADEEFAAKTLSAQTSAELKGMVCDDSYFVRNPETGYGTTVGGLNMRKGGRIGSDNPFWPVSKTDTKESRLASLIWELSNANEISMADAQKMLQRAYARAAKDPSYCGTAD
jgi:hypothetical protein